MKDSNRNLNVKASSQTPSSIPMEPVEKPAPSPSKARYQTPKLRRLGLLKSVAGSGISW
jgi:hypothetical protein